MGSIDRPQNLRTSVDAFLSIGSLAELPTYSPAGLGQLTSFIRDCTVGAADSPLQRVEPYSETKGSGPFIRFDSQAAL
jgi:hypothetical protein